MPEYYVRAQSLPPVSGYSHAVTFGGRMIAISGQVPADAQEYVSVERPPASSLVQVSRLVHPDFRVEIEALAAT